MMIILVFIMLCLNSVTAVNSNFKLFRHFTETGARCLDGSQAGLYYEEGVGANANNFVIFFNGTGSCSGTDLSSTLQSCYQLSKTEYGSSKRYAGVVNMENVSLLSATKQYNPLYHDWTRISIQSCDGSFHQGTRFNPIVYKNSELYFRGANNTLNTFSYLNDSFNLYASQKIVLAGVSSGAYATIFWANFLQSQAPNANIISISDSGIVVQNFLNPLTNKTLPDFYNELIKLVNTEISMPLYECVKSQSNQRECFRSEIFVKYLTIPTFFVQSLYDTYGLRNLLGLSCVPEDEAGSLLQCNVSQRRAIQAYRKAMITHLNQIYNSAPNIGVWGIACVQHGFLRDDSFHSVFYQVPEQSKITGLKAFEEFQVDPLNKSNNIHLDKVQWPYNLPCCGAV